MLDRLIDLILNFLHLFKFWVVIDEFEYGLVFTFGKPTRELKRGIRPVIPLAIEKVYVIRTWYDTVATTVQSLVTKDAKNVSVQGTFKYRLMPDKIRAYIITLGDEGTALSDYIEASVSRVVENSTWDELVEKPEKIRQEVLEEVRKHLNQFGFKFYDFQWTQKTYSRTLRLLMN